MYDDYTAYLPCRQQTAQLPIPQEQLHGTFLNPPPPTWYNTPIDYSRCAYERTKLTKASSNNSANINANIGNLASSNSLTNRNTSLRTTANEIRSAKSQTIKTERPPSTAPVKRLSTIVNEDADIAMAVEQHFAKALAATPKSPSCKDSLQSRRLPTSFWKESDTNSATTSYSPFYNLPAESSLPSNPYNFNFNNFYYNPSRWNYGTIFDQNSLNPYSSKQCLEKAFAPDRFNFFAPDQRQQYERYFDLRYPIDSQIRALQTCSNGAKFRAIDATGSSASSTFSRWV